MYVKKTNYVQQKNYFIGLCLLSFWFIDLYFCLFLSYFLFTIKFYNLWMFGCKFIFNRPKSQVYKREKSLWHWSKFFFSPHHQNLHWFFVSHWSSAYVYMKLCWIITIHFFCVNYFENNEILLLNLMNLSTCSSNNTQLSKKKCNKNPNSMIRNEEKNLIFNFFLTQIHFDWIINWKHRQFDLNKSITQVCTLY